MKQEIWLQNGLTMSDPAKEALTTNRAFLYGDGFFESMRMENGKICHLEAHQQRLLRSCQLLELDADTLPGLATLEQELIEKYSLEASKAWRLRMSIFRKDEGLYTPLGNTASWTLQVNELPATGKTGLSVSIYRRQAKAPGPFSNLKSISAQLYVMASLYAKQQQLDDVLIVNTTGNIIESSRANLFVCKQDELLTPPLSEGCIDGVYRHEVISKAQKIGWKIREEIITENILKEADEIWLSNAARGLMWVERCDQKIYGNDRFLNFNNKST